MAAYLQHRFFLDHRTYTHTRHAEEGGISNLDKNGWSPPRAPFTTINAAGVSIETMDGITRETMLVMFFADMSYYVSMPRTDLSHKFHPQSPCY